MGELKLTLPSADAQESAPNAIKPTPQIPDKVLQVEPTIKKDPEPVKDFKPAEPISRRGTRDQAITRSAMSCRGGTYRWGGCDVTTGIDCSGFTRYLYLKDGISLPHSAKLQYGMGKSVQRTDLVAGDLVFFGAKGSVTHVGMYVGGGKFIHASSPKRGIRVDLLSSQYYQAKYMGAKRYKA